MEIAGFPDTVVGIAYRDGLTEVLGKPACGGLHGFSHRCELGGDRRGPVLQVYPENQDDVEQAARRVGR